MEGDGGEEAGGEAGDGGAGGVGVGGEGGGADEAGGDDVGAGGGVAVAEEVEEVGVGHEEAWKERLLNCIVCGGGTGAGGQVRGISTGKTGGVREGFRPCTSIFLRFNFVL